MKHFDLNYKNTPLCSDCSLTRANRDIIFNAWFVQDAERNHSKLKTSMCLVSCSRQIFPTLSLMCSIKQACMVGILGFMEQMRELRNYDVPRVIQFANADFLPGSQVRHYAHSDSIPTPLSSFRCVCIFRSVMPGKAKWTVSVAILRCSVVPCFLYFTEV